VKLTSKGAVALTKTHRGRFESNQSKTQQPDFSEKVVAKLGEHGIL